MDATDFVSDSILDLNVKLNSQLEEESQSAKHCLGKEQSL